MSCHFLLQGIFLAQGSNWQSLLLLHWQAGSIPIELLGRPELYELFTHLKINPLLLCLQAVSPILFSCHFLLVLFMVQHMNFRE